MDNNLEDLLRKITENVDPAKGKVLQRIPVKPEWKKFYDEFERLRDKLADELMKAKTLRQHFWSTIEIDTGFFANNMRYDDKAGEILVYEVAPDNE